MAMIDEWGEQIDDIRDEGVFSETSLGDYESVDQGAVSGGTPSPGEAMEQGFPNTMPTEFPYAPTPARQVQRLDANRYGLYQGGGPQVRAEFPGQPIHPAAMGQVPVQQATAGMGCTCGCGGAHGMGNVPSDPWNLDALPGFETADQASAWGYDQWRTGGDWGRESGASWQETAGDISDLVGEAANLGMNLAAGITGMQQRSELHDQRMLMLSQEMERQNQLFATRLASLRQNPQENSDQIALIEGLQRQLQEAQQQGASPEVIAALLQQAQQATSTTPWGWIIGGVVALGLGGMALWYFTRD